MDKSLFFLTYSKVFTEKAELARVLWQDIQFSTDAKMLT